MTLAIIIPWRSRGDEHRDRAFDYVKKYYESLGIGDVIVVSDGNSGDALFHLARARNLGIESSGADVFLVTDADMLIPKEQIEEAAALATSSAGVVLPFDRWRSNFSEEQSQAVYDGRDWEQFIDHNRPSYWREGVIPEEWLATPAYIVSKFTWEMIGGWDERHIGWSPEDFDFLYGSTLVAPLRTVSGHCAQLYHPQPMFDVLHGVSTPEKINHDRGWDLNRAKQSRLRTIDEWRAETSMSRRMANLAEWFDYVRVNFEQFAGSPKRILQIGCYAGAATEWLLAHTSAHIVDIDTFAGSDDETTEDWDAVRMKYDTRVYSQRERVTTFVGTSDEFFEQYDGEPFDFVYVDGSHRRDDVYRDAQNAWNVLEDDGVLAFDDYLWWRAQGDEDRPGPAIDQFLRETPHHSVVVSNTQKWIRKLEVKPVRIAVYAPAKNEEANVQDWYNSARDADEVVLVDTGSTDKTLQRAQDLADLMPKLKVRTATVVPWRFDDGLNVALSQVSADIDIALPLHLDERLQPGWREELEKAWATGAKQFTFIYEWGPELTYRHDRIHARAGYRWVGAAHEYPSGPGPRTDTNLKIVQKQDTEKDRSQDDGLIELAWRERPTARTTYYWARQCYYRGRWDEARRLFLQYLSMPDAIFDQERAEACRMMSKMVFDAYKESWLLRACHEAPQRREPWVDLANHYRDLGMSPEASGALSRALRITVQDSSNSFHLEPASWNDDALRKLAASTE